MKRTRPLQRAAAPLARKTALRQKRPTPRRVDAATDTRVDVLDPVSQETRAEVRKRSGGRCEVGLPGCTVTAVAVHHRKLRRFGDHRPVNLLHVCRACHSAIHADILTSYDFGLLVRSTLDPADVEIRRRLL